MPGWGPGFLPPNPPITHFSPSWAPDLPRVWRERLESPGTAHVKPQGPPLSPGPSLRQAPMLLPPARPWLPPLSGCCPLARGQLASAWLPARITLLPCHPWATQPLPGPPSQQTCVPALCFFSISSPQMGQHLCHFHTGTGHPLPGGATVLSR